MKQVLDAWEAQGAKLVFFDNVYPYGRVDGWMTEALLFQPDIRGMGEMLYQHEQDYLFDCSKFNQCFDYRARKYAEGIREVAAEMKGQKVPG